MKSDGKYTVLKIGMEYGFYIHTSFIFLCPIEGRVLGAWNRDFPLPIVKCYLNHKMLTILAVNTQCGCIPLVYRMLPIIDKQDD